MSAANTWSLFKFVPLLERLGTGEAIGERAGNRAQEALDTGNGRPDYRN